MLDRTILWRSTTKLAVDPEQLKSDLPPVPRPCKHNPCDNCWLKYPQSLYPNWTPGQVMKSKIQEAIGNRGSCRIYQLDVDGQGLFKVQKDSSISSNDKNLEETWNTLLNMKVSIYLNQTFVRWLQPAASCTISLQLKRCSQHLGAHWPSREGLIHWKSIRACVTDARRKVRVLKTNITFNLNLIMLAFLDTISNRSSFLRLWTGSLHDIKRGRTKMGIVSNSLHLWYILESVAIDRYNYMLAFLAFRPYIWSWGNAWIVGPFWK